MKQRFYLLISLMTILMFSTSAFAVADGLAQLSSQANNTKKSKDNLSGGYSQKFWTWNKSKPPATAMKPFYMITPSPSFGDNLFSSLIYSYVFKQERDPISSSNKTVFDLMTNTIDQITQTMHNSFTLPFLLAPIAKLPLIFSYDGNFKAQRAQGDEAQNATNINKGISHYDLNALIAPIQYSINIKKPKEMSSQEQQAQGFIKYITGQLTPIQVVDFSKLYKENDNTPLLTALQMPSVEQYLLSLRRYAASVSVGLSNLNYMYNERKAYPTKELLQREGGSALANLPKDLNLPKKITNSGQRSRAR